MTLGQVVSNVLSAGLVASWVGLRAYEMYHSYNREHPEEVEESDDDIAYLARQEQLQRRRQAPHGPVIFTYSSSNGAQLFSGDGIMGGPTENPFGIDLLNLQLGLVDRDFDESDYEMLLALDRDGGGRGAPVSEEQLSALPTAVYGSRAAKQQAAAGEGASSYHQALQERYGASSGGGGGGSSSGSTAAGSGGGSSKTSPAAAEEEAPTCSICLDQFDEGAQVSALPCFHTFHQGCVEPWLRQQGRASTCPICKTPVFEGRA